MARVNHVKKARKSPGTCGKCDKRIAKGVPYIFWAFRYGGKRIRCSACPGPRPSDLTSNDKLSRCYAAGESISDAIDQFRSDREVDSLKSTMEDAANEVREVGEEYRESAQNIEDGFGHETEMSQQSQEKGDNLDSKADEIESAAGELEEFEDADDDPKEKSDDALDALLEEDGEDLSVLGAEDKERKRREKKNELQHEWEVKRDEWVEDQAQKAEEHTDIDPEG